MSPTRLGLQVAAKTNLLFRCSTIQTISWLIALLATGVLGAGELILAGNQLTAEPEWLRGFPTLTGCDSVKIASQNYRIGWASSTISSNFVSTVCN